MKKDIRIVVLPSGWVLVGHWLKKDGYCLLENAHVIRVWGTTKGIGELAMNGPTKNTILDRATIAAFSERTVIFTLTCEASKWPNI